MSAADHFLEFCARHFAACRRHMVSDAELLSMVEHHPALHDLTHPRGASPQSGPSLALDELENIALGGPA